ncbi:uncharacterized protein V1518DRAFT_421639 [Limtongia smithiae]|uniref:uncharacterized protein n=1 Tax=Limtongia smithiae TaxID=1125753 RepID=UPI0034CFC2A2
MLLTRRTQLRNSASYLQIYLRCGRQLRFSSSSSDGGDDEPFLSMPLVNTLHGVQSPYLRSHASNPVAWQRFSDATFKRAVRENKPVFLCIGFHACHWCRRMNDEVFAAPAVAEVLNAEFIPVLVDRDERPDVNAVYMGLFQVAHTQAGGGWPLNSFLMPRSRRPFFGGTFWPGPEDEQKPGFLEVAKRIEATWKEKREMCEEVADSSVAAFDELLAQRTTGAEDEIRGTSEIMKAAIPKAFEFFKDTFDIKNGGFGEAPKFPMPSVMSMLLRVDAQLPQPPPLPPMAWPGLHSNSAREMAMRSLESIASGGIHDHVGGGFMRFSSTAEWSLPHFEKMLVDNALLLHAYVDAYALSATEFARDAIVDIANYLVSGPLTNAEGGISSSEGADSAPADNAFLLREGAFYVWTYKDLFRVLGRADGDIAAEYWNVTEFGNVDPEKDVKSAFVRQNVLATTMRVEQLAGMFGKSEDTARDLIAGYKEKLRADRSAHRAHPAVDKQIITAWNGLAIGALVRAAGVMRPLDPEAAEGWLQAACKAVGFIRENMYDESEGVLYHVYLNGVGNAPALLEDYSYLVAGLRELYAATFELEYLEWATALAKRQDELFWDEAEGTYLMAPVKNQAELAVRIMPSTDTHRPSASSVAALNALALSAYADTVDEQQRLLERPKRVIHKFGKDIMDRPHAYASMLLAADILARGPAILGIVVGGRATDTAVQSVLDAVRGVLLTTCFPVLLDLRSDIAADGEVEHVVSVLKAHNIDIDEDVARGSDKIVLYIHRLGDELATGPVDDLEPILEILKPEVIITPTEAKKSPRTTG